MSRRPTRPNRRRRLGSTFLPALMVLALAACSGQSASPEADRSPTDPTSNAAERDDDFPVTVEHLLGTATIERRPERVATLGVADLDTVLALGITPVVGVHQPGRPDEPFPWAAGPLGSSDILLVDAEALGPQAEAVIAEHPDLVLGTTANADEAAYDRHADLGVPLIGPIDAPFQDTWQARTIAIGTAVGRSTEAEAVIAETESLLADFAAERPGLEGKTFAMANSIGGGQVRAIASPDSSSTRLLQALGLEVAPGLSGVPLDPDGGVTLSLEQLDLLDADVILITGREGDRAMAEIVTENPTFEGLAAAERGTVLIYDRLVGTALRAPSVLSIPWVLDQLADVLTLTAQATTAPR